MMISPESYYKEYLKGKTEPEIKRQIVSIKREIGHWIRIAESTGTDEGFIFPQPETIIQMNYEYLEQAKNALKEVGGEVVLSARDLAAEQFERDLDHMASFSFIIGLDDNEYDAYLVKLEDDQVLFSYYNSKDISIENGFYEEDDKMALAPFTAQQLKELLCRAKMGFWRRRLSIREGSEAPWKITFCYTNKNPRTFFGAGYRPWSFEMLVLFFEEAREELAENG